MYHESSSSPPLPSEHAKQPADSSPGVGGVTPSAGDSPLENAISSDLIQHIADIEHRLDLLSEGDTDSLDEELRSYAGKAVEARDTALSAAHYAIVYAWASGSVLNLAKERLSHGQFKPWCEMMAAEAGVSVRTAQHWMKLAASCYDVRALLVPGGTLTGAYRAAGVLPPPPDPPNNDKNDNKDDEAFPSTPIVEMTFTALANGRMALRRLEQSAVELSEEDRERILAEKTAYIELFDRSLNPIIT
jgi:hypothetical protein